MSMRFQPVSFTYRYWWQPAAGAGMLLSNI
jgi:hypothetical protein